MILKELDPFSGSDKFLVAGRRAEEQMAHYLRRFFGGSPHIDVLNYLRIELAGEVAQMDHLIVHPFGLTIVESKSVASSIQIKDDGQWIRWFDKRPQGIRSPVTQARMQAMLLRDLLSRTVRQKGFFDSVELDVLVAISDTGTIQWPSTGPLPEVCKADQVPERILQKVSARQGSAAAQILIPQHREAIAEFLKKIHKPLFFTQTKGATATTPPKAEVSAPISTSSTGVLGAGPALPQKACKHCGGSDLEAQHGKFGYYFVCRGCGKNTAIRFSCPQCGGEGRIRKQGNEFFAECRACDASQLYHTNN